MININTSCNKDSKVIRDFEAFFEKYVLAKDFEQIDLDVIKSIDNATVLDKKTGAIHTRFGMTNILDLSTGCKVVLSYLYIKRHGNFSDRVLDITECGSNALEVLFQCVDMLSDSETVFLLRHSIQLFKCSNRDYNVNGHNVESLYEGVIRYGKVV